MDTEINAEPELSEDEKIDAIVDLIPDEDEGEAGDPNTVIADDPDQVTIETDAPDPIASVITPPDSWTAEAREKFAALSPDLQQVIVERDREQKSAFNRQVNEVAEQKKAIETERQRYAQGLDHFLNNAIADPILVEGQKTDWVKLSQEDPVAYVEKKAQYEHRLAQAQTAYQERAQLEQRNYTELRTREANALLERVPEWKDPKVYMPEWQDMKAVGAKVLGFTEQEMEGFTDHRLILGLRKIAQFEKAQKAQATVQAKKVVPPVKVQKPGGGEVTGRGDAKALKQRLANTSGMHERAAMIAGMIED